MLVMMKRKVFDSLDDAALESACVEPTLQRLHSRISPAVKSQVLAQLTDGQKAQFMFRVLYAHLGNSVVDFYCWVSICWQKRGPGQVLRAGYDISETMPCCGSLKRRKAFLK